MSRPVPNKSLQIKRDEIRWAPVRRRSCLSTVSQVNSAVGVRNVQPRIFQHWRTQPGIDVHFGRKFHRCVFQAVQSQDVLGCKTTVYKPYLIHSIAQHRSFHFHFHFQRVHSTKQFLYTFCLLLLSCRRVGHCYQDPRYIKEAIFKFILQIYILRYV